MGSSRYPLGLASRVALVGAAAGLLGLLDRKSVV